MKEPCYFCKESEAKHFRLGRPGDLFMSYSGTNLRNGEGLPFGYCDHCWHTYCNWGKYEIEISFEDYVLHKVMTS